MKMKNTHLAILAASLFLIVPASATDDAAPSTSNCNNNGIVVQASATGNNSYHCEANVQFCDNVSGAGAGAGAGGPSQSNEAGAEGSASGRCNQYSGGNTSCFSLYSEMHCNSVADAGSFTESS